jgi:predicted SAM-dependent methyltransferase
MDKKHLNLGCGLRKLGGFVNIDKRECVNPDVVLDIEADGLKLWDDDSIEYVIASDFLEHIHIDRTMFVIDEIWRVLRHEGVFEHLTPSTQGFGAFQDPTHVSFWNPNSWLYYCNEDYRKLYNTRANFLVAKLEHRETSHDMSIWHTYGLMKAVKK